MAGIDRTYTKSYCEYKSLINWAKDKVFVCPNGIKIEPKNSIYYGWTENDFDGTERPVMNTSNTTDYFLIKYCPLSFVQNRMKEVYDGEYDSIKNGTSKYDTFTKEGKYGTKVKCIKKPDIISKYPWGQKKWFVQLIEPDDDYLWYNEDFNKWVWPYELGWGNTNTCWKFKTIKSLIRNIRKWKLPKGTIVKASSRYVGLDWKFKVK